MRERTFRPAGGDRLALMAMEDGRQASRCFADEVGIDFPSMLPAVDRIRDAFVADERPAPLRTAIRLSRREARDGARVPLEVPVRATCRPCGGRGESWCEVCTHCGGSGTGILRHQLQVTIPAGVLDGARFQFTLTPRHDLPTRIELRVVVTGSGDPGRA